LNKPPKSGKIKLMLKNLGAQFSYDEIEDKFYVESDHLPRTELVIPQEEKYGYIKHLIETHQIAPRKFWEFNQNTTKINNLEVVTDLLTEQEPVSKVLYGAFGTHPKYRATGIRLARVRPLKSEIIEWLHINQAPEDIIAIFRNSDSKMFQKDDPFAQTQNTNKRAIEAFVKLYLWNQHIVKTDHTRHNLTQNARVWFDEPKKMANPNREIILKQIKESVIDEITLQFVVDEGKCGTIYDTKQVQVNEFTHEIINNPTRFASYVLNKNRNYYKPRESESNITTKRVLKYRETAKDPNLALSWAIEHKLYQNKQYKMPKPIQDVGAQAINHMFKKVTQLDYQTVKPYLRIPVNPKHITELIESPYSAEEIKRYTDARIYDCKTILKGLENNIDPDVIHSLVTV